jgi:hypothetical protein
LPLRGTNGIFLLEVLMKRFCIVLVVVLAAAAATGAQETAAPPAADGVQAELSAALQEMSAAQIGTLSVADLVKVAARVSIAEQKIAYVQKVRMASMMLPGAGQFITGDTLGGSLFVIGDVAIMAGAMIGSYFLLPGDLQFTGTDYLNTPFSTIRTRWEGHTFMEYLPAFGVMAGGMLLKGILGHFSAVSAAGEARKKIADGSITFTPNFAFMGRGFGMGMTMHMRM